MRSFVSRYWNRRGIRTAATRRRFTFSACYIENQIENVRASKVSASKNIVFLTFHSFKHAVRHALLASSLPSGTNNAWICWFIVSSFLFPCYTVHEDISILQSTAWWVAKDHLIPNSYMCRHPFQAQTIETLSPYTYHLRWQNPCVRDKSFRLGWQSMLLSSFYALIPLWKQFGEMSRGK